MSDLHPNSVTSAGWTCANCGVWVQTEASPHTCSTRSMGAAEAAAFLTHHHRWVYDGQGAQGHLIYHCDEHDPPVVRVVWPGVTL